MRKFYTQPLPYVNMVILQSVVTMPHQGLFCVSVQCIKACMTAQSYYPLASDTHPRQTHHNQCCR